MKEISSGVTAAKGFRAAGLRAGIKAGKTNKDMAMIYSEAPAVCAGTFTKNIVKAAPVLWDQKVVSEEGHAQAVVINSGIANACTGEEGYANCEKEAEKAAELLGIGKKDVLICSTGVIGVQLDMDVVEKGIGMLAPAMKADEESASDAAEAILTTDTHKKEIAVQCEIDGQTVVVGGMSKGSGMIHPNMGTMLAFITSDAAIEQPLLQEILREEVEDTFNMISVDGDTSTNDTVLLLANGRAENEKIRYGTPEYDRFCEALHYVNETLAKKMAGDGEGATALFEAKIVGAQSKEQAKVLAKSIVCSSLTKTAIAGHDANWGRILCAMGYSGAKFDPEKVTLFFESSAGKLKIIENGVAVEYSEEKATEILSQPEVKVTADIGEGDAQAAAWGCDLTHEYININADYRS